MKILLLGGTGYLGSNIAKRLVEECHQVICVVRPTSDINRLQSTGRGRIRFISNELWQMKLTFQQECIDWVINSVCVYKPNKSLYGDMIDANVIFPLQVFNLAMQYGTKNFMTMGTSLPANFNVYSFSKSKFADFGRYYGQRGNINFIELALEMFYGAENEPDARFMRSCALKLSKNEPLLLTEGYQKRDMIRVEDLIEMILILVKSKNKSGYQLFPAGSGEQHSIREIVEFMRKTMHSKSELRFGAVQSRQGEPDTIADISWLKDVGYQMKYSFFCGLKDYCEKI